MDKEVPMKFALIALAFFPLLSQAALHPNYAAVKLTMQNIANRSQLQARVVDIGVSDSGDMIQALQIGNGPVRNLVVASHHGNEYGSVEVALDFAEATALNPIPGQTITVIPVLNIAGFNRRNRYERNHDPNRDYPGPCVTEDPFNLKSTKALADFLERENIVASATLHTYYPAVVYPWGLSTPDLDTPHTNTYKRLAELAALDSNYQTGNSSEVIYPADGTFEDYAFWKHGVWSLLFELGFSHFPSEADIETMKRVNTPGLRRFFEQAPRMRAENHEFTGRCDLRLRALDRHDE
jgi:carboxypeptidase T